MLKRLARAVRKAFWARPTAPAARIVTVRSRPAPVHDRLHEVLQALHQCVRAGDIDGAASLLLSEEVGSIDQKRTDQWVQSSLGVAGALYARHQFLQAFEILRRATPLAAARTLPMLASAAVHCNRGAEAAAMLDEALADQPTADLIYARSTLSLEAGDLDETARLLAQVDAGGDARLSRYVERDANFIGLVRESASIMETMPQPSDPIGVTVICNDGPFIDLWATLPALELRQRGYATVCAVQRAAIPLTPAFDPEIATLHGALRSNGTVVAWDEADETLRHQWTIDWPNKVVKAGEINAYQGIFERMSTILKKYTIDINAPDARSMFAYYLLQSDRALTFCEKIRDHVAGRGLAVRFFVSGSHFAPFYICKQFCAQVAGAVDMQCITFYPAYEHYYNNLGSSIATRVSVINDSRSPERRSGLYASRQQFEAWLALQADSDGEASKARVVLNFNRTGLPQLPVEAEQVMERIKAHKQRGGKVACLFGKIVYDMAVPYDGGPAHVDMVDWLNHTIEVANESETLLLIKPHPNEVRADMHQPAEMFLDLIRVRPSSNVIVLQHHWLNMRDIVPHIDVGLLWHGTSALELGMSGVPVVVASHWGRLDHPIDFAFPKDREHYAAMVGKRDSIPIPPDYAKRCALLSKYLSTDEIMIPYRYAIVPFLAPKDGSKPTLPGWNSGAVEEYMRDGDPHVDRIVSVCL